MGNTSRPEADGGLERWWAGVEGGGGKTHSQAVPGHLITAFHLNRDKEVGPRAEGLQQSHTKYLRTRSAVGRSGGQPQKMRLSLQDSQRPPKGARGCQGKNRVKSGSQEASAQREVPGRRHLPVSCSNCAHKPSKEGQELG